MISRLGLAVAIATTASFALYVPGYSSSPALAQTELSAPDVLAVDFSETAEQETVGDRTVTTFGDPSLTYDGVVGQQVGDFDGDDAWFYPLSEEDFDTIQDGFTLECSFRYGEDLPPNEVSLCGNKQGGGFAMLVHDGQVKFSVHDGSGYKKATYPITGNTWYHVAGVFADGEAKLYVNGELVDSVATQAQMQKVSNEAARNFVIGGDSAPGYSDNLSQARIEGAYLWSGALSSAEIAARAEALHVETGTVPTADMFNVDLANGNYDDTVGNRPYSLDGEPQIREDKALGQTVASFNNDAAVYQIGGEYSMYDDIRSGFSVECTFRYNGPLPTSGEAGVCSNKQGGGFSITLYEDFLTFAVNTGEYNYARFKVEPNEWYHTVGVFDGETAKLYINGELATEVKTGQDKLKVPTNERAHIWTLAADAGDASAQYHGPMEVANSRIYAQPLTPQQVTALKDQAFANADTSAPTIAAISPAADSAVNSETLFNIEWENPDLIAADTRYFVDGQQVTPGQDVGTNLVSGKHTLKVEGKTVFGDPIDMDVEFESGTILDGGGTSTEAGSAQATLSARATNPTGERYATTFYKGKTTQSQTSFQGLTSEVPSTLDFDFTGDADVALGQASPSAHQGQVAFQRFDFAASPDQDGQSVRWSGQVDPARGVRLMVWNVAQSQWDELAYGRGQAEGPIQLMGEVGADHIDGDVIHALVIGVDPFADDLENVVQPEFENPDDYDFSLVQYSDTQFLSEGATEDSYSEEQRAIWAESYQSILDWIKDNEVARKIQYVALSGDIVENWVLADYGDQEEEQRERAIKEFEFAAGLQREFEKLEIPHGVLAGNHDNRNGTETGSEALYNEYFGPEFYNDLSQTDGWKARNASYHAYAEGDNSNHYDLFSAGGQDFVVVQLGYGVDETEAAWARDVLAQYPDRNGIVVAHSYNGPSTQPDGRGGYFSYDGSIIKEQIVDPSPNVAMVLSGHENGVSITARRGIDGKDSNVVELLADYQEYTFTADEVGLTGIDGRSADDELKMGSNFLRLFQFDVDRGEVSVDTFSPMLEEFGSSEHDTRNRYDGSEDDFKVPVQLKSRATSFVTDNVLLTSATDEEIGTVEAESGWPAEITWDGLTPGESYSWYAISYPVGAEPEDGFVAQSGSFQAMEATADDKAPTLTVGDDVTISAGQDFDPMQGVTATDDTDGDLTAEIKVTGSVDTATPGEYELSYTVEDSAGNQAVAQRTVTVEESDSGSPQGSSDGSADGSADGSSDGSSDSSDDNGVNGSSQNSVLAGVFGALAGLLGALGLGGILVNFGKMAFPRQFNDVERQIRSIIDSLGF